VTKTEEKELGSTSGGIADVKRLIKKYHAILDWDAVFPTDVRKDLTAGEYLAT
jgi:hypothetical protein